MKIIRQTKKSEFQAEAARHAAVKVFIACTMTMLGVSTVFMTQSIFVEISESFRSDLARVYLAFSVASLFYAAAFFFLGPATDRFNLPAMAVGGLGLLAVTVLWASCTNDFGIFLSSMALMGICAATIPASMFPYIATISPHNKQGLYIGLMVASATMGFIFGRVSMGLLTARAGWQLSFRIYAAILLLLAGIAGPVLIRKQKQERRPVKNILGMYADSVRLMSNPETSSFLMVGFGLFFGALGIITFLTYRLVASPYNFTSAQVGYISFAGITALIAPFAGNLCHKIGAMKIILIGLMLCLAALQLLSWFQSTIWIALGVLLLFLGVYSCQPLLFLLIGQHVSKELLGSASSLYFLFCIGGGSLSTMVLGPVWRLQGWNGVAVICSAALAISLFIMIMRGLKLDAISKPKH